MASSKNRLGELGMSEDTPWKEAGLLNKDECWPATQLFAALKQNARTYIRFKEEVHYDVLASWVLGTWLIDKWRAFGPLYLLGDVGSGKTTVLEWLEEVCYHAVRGGSMSTSVMFHLSHMSTPTLLIDETQLYNRDEYAETQALINESYRKGGKVWRMTGEGRNMKPQFFNAYGPRAFAASYPPWAALADRALTINMEATEEELSETLTTEFYEETRKLRDQLAAWADLERHNHLAPSKDVLAQIRNHRVREIGYPLLSSSPEHAHEAIIIYLKDLEERHRTRKQTGSLADYLQALLDTEPENGKVSAKLIREWFIEHWDVSKDKAPSSKVIMNSLETLGFRRTLVHGGIAGVLYDHVHLEELRLAYGLPPSGNVTQTNLPNAPSPSQVGKVGKVGQIVARCEYCDQPFTERKQYEKHACPIGTRAVPE